MPPAEEIAHLKAEHALWREQVQLLLDRVQWIPRQHAARPSCTLLPPLRQ